MDNLTNGTSYQIFMSGGCHPANFAYDCFAKHYLISPNGGGIAFIGNTDTGWTDERLQLRYFLEALYSIGRYDIGSSYHNSLSGTSYGHEQAKRKWRLHLLGDPEMQVWTNTPQTFTVTTSPASLQVGTQTLTVTVSGLNLPTGETALLCVSKGTEVYETQLISGNGSYTVPISVETPGTLNVTVTAHNYIPVEQTIQVNASIAPNLYIDSVDFVDDGTSNSVGNSNGKNDAGETIYLQVVVKNNGTNTASGVTATLSCNSDSITILSNASTLGNIASGSPVTGNFLYQIDKEMHETLSNAQNNPITFQLEMRDAANTVWTKTFNIDVFATELKQRNKIIVTPANGVIGANTSVTLNIELQNRGKAPSQGLTAILSSNSSSIASCSATPRTYPAIGFGETKPATQTFQFQTAANYVSGNPLNFNLTVQNAYGKTWAYSFNLLDRPAKITSLDFMGDVSAIEISWPSRPNVQGYYVYRSDADAAGNAVGDYQKVNPFVVTSAFLRDEGLAPLTKYYYKVSAVGLNGNESEWSDPLATMTSYGFKGLFPIQMDNDSVIGIRSSINVEDVYLNGKKAIFTATTSGDLSRKGYIVALDNEGVELFDIDNNVTTYSGFAKFNAAINANIAVGDLFATGEYQVVSVTRDQSPAKDNHVTIHSLKDTDGDHRPDVLWQQATTWTYRRGAILDNIDNSSDGSKEIILRSDANAGVQKIQIRSANGNLLYEFGASNSYSALAVADLDGDGDKEIIAGYPDGVYIWHHDGTPFSVNPFFTKPGYQFSSPVVCDIDNDGEKEILTVAQKTQGIAVCAIKLDGTMVNNTWGTDIDLPTNPALSKEISVGDLDHDGNLEVVVAENKVYVFDKDGVEISNTTFSGIEGFLNPAILADVDEDPDIEIIVNSETGKVYGINMDGSTVLGFPLRKNISGLGSCAVADLDNDGKNEIIASGGPENIYVWATAGDADKIEWGSERHDARNTGEYSQCSTVVISSNTVWDSNKDICGDIIVASGSKLTINSNCTVIMGESSMIIVKAGAILEIDGGQIWNTNVKALPQSTVKLLNGAYVKLRKKGVFSIPQGALYQSNQSKIDITP